MNVTEQRILALGLLRQGYTTNQIPVYLNVEPGLLTQWQKEYDYIQQRLDLLYSLLSYCTSKGGVIFSAAERIHINQERARLMRNDPDITEYPYPYSLKNKIKFTIDKIHG